MIRRADLDALEREPGHAKAVVVVCSDPAVADDVSRLCAATLSLNGYRHNGPSVIDWPVAGLERTGFVQVELDALRRLVRIADAHLAGTLASLVEFDGLGPMVTDDPALAGALARALEPEREPPLGKAGPT